MPNDQSYLAAYMPTHQAVLRYLVLPRCRPSTPPACPMDADLSMVHRSDGIECAICKEAMDSKDDLLHGLACGHLFHHVCLATWSDARSLGFSELPCPVCKRTQAECSVTERELYLEGVPGVAALAASSAGMAFDVESDAQAAVALASDDTVVDADMVTEPPWGDMVAIEDELIFVAPHAKSKAKAKAKSMTHPDWHRNRTGAMCRFNQMISHSFPPLHLPNTAAPCQKLPLPRAVHR